MSITLQEYATKAREKIREHASRAIVVLQDQLTTAKSPVKIAKLKHRIEQWQHSLEQLNKDDHDKKESTRE
jgi:hypothetical protein